MKSMFMELSLKSKTFLESKIKKKIEIDFENQF